MPPPTKDYIFGMLFLKRCSDVFEAEHDRIVGRKVEQGMIQDEAEVRYGENPDYYDGFFVPERARWRYPQSRLGDATEPYGGVLDKALGALSEHNESLEHVLDHISFMRAQGTKRIVSDDACKDLVRHFSRHKLRNEDFQFSDLLGAAYEFLINMFAESAGKKGGDFYTPRDVIRLMVRILKPRPGLSVYDPTCGSGGMLIISREFVEQSGGDPTNLRLCGQVNDASAWSICKLNMLLHGVPGADIQLADTLLHPMHRDGGELERFDRVIANPPFSQNYTRSNMEFPECFRWGWCPTSGKKGDLMFAQHMLAVCKPGGMVATVMPHGVLFRGGAEKEIRRKWLEQDLVEAVIGLPPNLFYGAGIPACILVLRPNLSGQSLNPHKPAERRGQVLFVNADRPRRHPPAGGKRSRRPGAHRGPARRACRVVDRSRSAPCRSARTSPTQSGSRRDSRYLRGGAAAVGRAGSLQGGGGDCDLVDRYLARFQDAAGKRLSGRDRRLGGRHCRRGGG